MDLIVSLPATVPHFLHTVAKTIEIRCLENN